MGPMLARASRRRRTTSRPPHSPITAPSRYSSSSSASSSAPGKGLGDGLGVRKAEGEGGTLVGVEGLYELLRGVAEEAAHAVDDGHDGGVRVLGEPELAVDVAEGELEAHDLPVHEELHAVVVVEEGDELAVPADLVLHVLHQRTQPRRCRGVGIPQHPPLQEVFLRRVLLDVHAELPHFRLLLQPGCRLFLLLSLLWPMCTG